MMYSKVGWRPFEQFTLCVMYIYIYYVLCVMRYIYYVSGSYVNDKIYLQKLNMIDTLSRYENLATSSY